MSYLSTDTTDLAHLGARAESIAWAARSHRAAVPMTGAFSPAAQACAAAVDRARMAHAQAVARSGSFFSDAATGLHTLCRELGDHEAAYSRSFASTGVG